MGREFELKYRAAPETLERIRAEYGEFSATAMETVYYDTPEGALSRRRWTLRSRRENDRQVCTVKTLLPDGSRGEWEVEGAGLPVQALAAMGAPETLAEDAKSGFIPVANVRFLRLARRLNWNGALLELALDRGEFLAPGRVLPFAEVEVEVKSGADDAAMDFGRKLSETYGLIPEPESKFRRALDFNRSGGNHVSF